jgi:ribosome-associated toxin RatA of RatAB toxin-antitoxin module
MILVSPALRRKTPSIIIWLFLPIGLGASVLQFPDSSGKVVAQKPDYVIRLIETPSSNIKTAEAMFLIKGSPFEIYKAVTDFENYPHFMPHICKSELVEKNDISSVYRFAFRLALWTIRYTNKFESGQSDNGDYFIRWGYVAGDLKKTTGEWNIGLFKQKDGYSLVRYKVYVDAGKFLPLWVIEKLTAKSIPAMITAIGRRVAEEN